jgi:hypothetical protein
LINVTDSGLSFADTLEALPAELQTSVKEMLERIDRRSNVRARTLRFPRRMLRHLARTPRPAVVATAFGHAFRCLWADGSQVRFEGSCSADFVSKTFRIHLRTVKAARKELHECGWLVTLDAEAWHVRRYGSRIRVNSAWRGAKAVDNSKSRMQSIGTKTPPHRAATGTESPPAYSKQGTSSSTQKPKPADRRPFGAKGGLRNRDAASLLNLNARDLEDPQRLDQIHAECIRRGLINGGESDRLNLVAAACRARRVSTVNACGMFRAIVEQRCWSNISQIDEDMARSMLRSPPSDANSLLNAIGFPVSSNALGQRGTETGDGDFRGQGPPGSDAVPAATGGRRSAA